MLSGYVWAQPQPAASDSEEKSRNQAAPKEDRKLQLKPDAQLGGGSMKVVSPGDRPGQVAKDKTKTPTKRAKRGGRKPPFEMDPNAKWACDPNTVTLPPVWRGSQSLAFAFDIRNEGTANLRIKARGG